MRDTSGAPNNTPPDHLIKLRDDIVKMIDLLRALTERTPAQEELLNNLTHAVIEYDEDAK